MTLMSDSLTPPIYGVRYNIKDGQRPITFVGALIAGADSQTGDDKRWTELTLYRTDGGTYILEKIGRSDVFHSASCRRKSKGREYPSLDDAFDDLVPEDQEMEDDGPEHRFIPCEACSPAFDVQPAWVEQDIPTVATLPNANELISSLYHATGGSSRFLSRVARALLDNAAKMDEDIAAILAAPAEIK